MQESINSYPLPSRIRFKLVSTGYTTMEDVKSSTIEELCKDTGLLRDEVLDLLKMLTNDGVVSVGKRSLMVSSHTAFNLLHQEKSVITTSCHKLDEILDGGLPIMKLTEICGAPGIGKTQMGLQFCINVQLPRTFGGLEGEAVFIDTEGSFVVERVVDLISAAIENISQNSASVCMGSNLSVDGMLKGIHVYRCKGYIELIAAIRILPEFLKTHTKVRVIIIDSIAFHFRYGFDGSYGLRTRLLSGIAQSLIKLATDFNLAIVLTNQMTTKFDAQNNSYLMPSLGDSWGHACTIRIILYWEGKKHWALLSKSPWKKEAAVQFQITTAGIRDVDNDTFFLIQKRDLSSPSSSNQLKKSKCHS